MKYLVLIASLLFCNTCFSQENKPTIKWGPELEIMTWGAENRGWNDSLISLNQTGCYLYNHKTDRIEKLDTGFNSISYYDFNKKDPETKEKFDLEGYVWFAKKLWVLKSTLDKNTALNNVFALEINGETMKEVKTAQPIPLLQFDNTQSGVSIQTIHSISEKSLMIVAILHGGTDHKEQFNSILLDSNMQVVCKNKITLTSLTNQFGHTEIKCDDLGNIYILGKLYKNKVDFDGKEKEDYTYHLLSYNKNGSLINDYEIHLNENFIIDIKMYVDLHGKIKLTGFYSKNNKLTIDGAFIVGLDENSKTMANLKMVDFDLSSWVDFMNNKTEENKNVRKYCDLFNFKVCTSVLRPNGDFLLVGEQRSPTIHYTSDILGWNCKNIIVVNFDSAGKMKWLAKIPKFQMSYNQPLDFKNNLSFAFSVSSTKLHFVYNEPKGLIRDEGNLAVDGEVNPLKDKNRHVMSVTVDENGQVTRQELFNFIEKELSISTNLCRQIDENHLLIFGERKNVNQFGIVTFN